MAEHQLPLRLRLPPDTRAPHPTPPQVFLQNKARREDFCPRKLRQMHLMIDQLMAHSQRRPDFQGPTGGSNLRANSTCQARRVRVDDLFPTLNKIALVCALAYVPPTSHFHHIREMLPQTWLSIRIIQGT